MSHVPVDDYYEAMAQASKYRPKSYSGKGDNPIALSGVMIPSGLTASQHRPSYAGYTNSLYGASPVPTSAPGLLGYREHSAASHAADSVSSDTVYRNQTKKILRELQQHVRDLQRERNENESLRQELQERDAAVQDARSVARSAKQQLVLVFFQCLT
jgi:hypothetical protein